MLQQVEDINIFCHGGMLQQVEDINISRHGGMLQQVKDICISCNVECYKRLDICISCHGGMLRQVRYMYLLSWWNIMTGETNVSPAMVDCYDRVTI